MREPAVGGVRPSPGATVMVGAGNNGGSRGSARADNINQKVVPIAAEMVLVTAEIMAATAAVAVAMAMATVAMVVTTWHPWQQWR